MTRVWDGTTGQKDSARVSADALDALGRTEEAKALRERHSRDEYAARGPSTPPFDHLVGACEQRWRNREAERLRRDQIDDKLKLRRLLDWVYRRASSRAESCRPTRRRA
jgi:hypothetical protein